jgi:Glycosyltransferase family 9 (heptosyltransferase)
VGIVWTGNDKNLSNASKSMPLATMLSMLVPDLIVISLQMGVPPSDVATLQAACHVLDLSECQDDFADTAAVISHLDLVISVDTSVAHLAGAMCVPVWVLLSAPADWRWLLDREDSPWYSSARLFRQHRSGDWSDVARQVREALQRMTGST